MDVKMKKAKKVKTYPVPKEVSEKATALGVEIEWDQYNRNIRRIKLNFKPEVWADLANGDGELLQRCCSTISAIRDEFIGAMREDGWMDADDILAIAQCKSPSHSFPPDHPVGIVNALYAAFEKHLGVFRRHLRTFNLEDPEDMCMVAGMSKVVHFCSEHAFNQHVSNWGKETTDCAQHNIELFHLIPVVKCIAAKMQSFGFPPVEGYAIVRKADNNICELRRGLAVFPTKEQAEGIIQLWLKNPEVKPDTLEVRPVRVSWEKGIEFIGQVEVPFKPFVPIPDEDKHAVFDALEELERKVKDDRTKVIIENARTQILDISE
jgi:hypothetical protein